MLKSHGYRALAGNISSQHRCRKLVAHPKCELANQLREAILQFKEGEQIPVDCNIGKQSAVSTASVGEVSNSPKVDFEKVGSPCIGPVDSLTHSTDQDLLEPLKSMCASPLERALLVEMASMGDKLMAAAHIEIAGMMDTHKEAMDSRQDLLNDRFAKLEELACSVSQQQQQQQQRSTQDAKLKELSDKLDTHMSKRVKFDDPSVGDMIVPTLAYCEYMSMPMQELKIEEVCDDGTFFVDGHDFEESNFMATCNREDIDHVIKDYLEAT